MKRTGPTNPGLQNLIKELRILSQKNKAPIWKRVATELERSTRQRRKVNLFHIEKYCNNGETIIVPGKVLATGDLTKQVKIAAWAFSEEASKKIKDAISIHQLIKENPNGKNVRIIG